MRLPSFKSLKKGNSHNISNEKIFTEAIELAQTRLEQYIADLQDRIRNPKQALDRGAQLNAKEMEEPAA